MDYAEIVTTSIGDNSLSSLQVPKGWEILAWQHDFYGETRLFQAIETDMACADMDEFADNEASALTVRKLTAEPEPVEPEPVVEVAPPLPDITIDPEPVEPEIIVAPPLPDIVNDPEPVEPEIIVAPPLPDIVVEPEPVIYAMMYGDKDCSGDAWPIYFPTDGSTEVNLDFGALQHDTSIGDNSLSSV